MLTAEDKAWLSDLGALMVAAVVQSMIGTFTSQIQSDRCKDIRQFGRTGKSEYQSVAPRT
jgi:hypothetical protein